MPATAPRSSNRFNNRWASTRTDTKRLQIQDQLSDFLRIERNEFGVVVHCTQRAGIGNEKPFGVFLDYPTFQQKTDAAAHGFQRHIEYAPNRAAADACRSADKTWQS